MRSRTAKRPCRSSRRSSVTVTIWHFWIPFAPKPQTSRDRAAGSIRRRTCPLGRRRSGPARCGRSDLNPLLGSDIPEGCEAVVVADDFQRLENTRRTGPASQRGRNTAGVVRHESGMDGGGSAGREGRRDFDKAGCTGAARADAGGFARCNELGNLCALTSLPCKPPTQAAKRLRRCWTASIHALKKRG